jgi:hypothetical protein
VAGSGKATVETLQRVVDAFGERLEVRGCDLWEFEGDKLARKDSYWKLVER